MFADVQLHSGTCPLRRLAQPHTVGVIRKLKNAVMIVERMKVGGSDGIGRRQDQAL